MDAEKIALKARNTTDPEARLVFVEGTGQSDHDLQIQGNGPLQGYPEAASPNVLEKSGLNPTRPSFITEFPVLEAWAHAHGHRFEQKQIHLINQKSSTGRQLHGINHSNEYGT